MKKYLSLLLVFLFCLSAAPGFSQETPPDIDPNDSDAQWEWYDNQIIQHGGEVTELQPLHFTAHGRVLDQYGDPITNAQVEVSWMSDRLVNFVQMVDEVTLTTDAGGNFSFDAVKERFPGIGSITKTGYEYEPSLNTFPSLRRDEKLEALINSTEQNPVIIYLRKMGETTYLFHDDDLFWQFKQPHSFMSYDIYRRGLYDIAPDPSKFKDYVNIDLVIEAQNNSNEGHFVFKVMAPLETSGVQLRDDKLYSAPIEGYIPEITIILNHGEELQKYLYFTSRKLEYESESGEDQYKPIYSRMEIKLEAEENQLIFYYDTWTNPYGSPNLEYELDMPADLFIKLRDESKKAIQSGKLPPEPNLQEMMASGQYN